MGGVSLGLPAAVFDDWLYNGVLVGAALVCAARAVLVREERLAWALIASACCVERGGRLLHRGAREARGAAVPSISDAGWLIFYPAFWVAWFC